MKKEVKMNSRTKLHKLFKELYKSKQIFNPFQLQTVEEAIQYSESFDLLKPDYWNDFKLLHLSSILRKFTEKLNFDEIGLKLRRETALLLFLAFINRFKRIESWKQTQFFDVTYRVKDDDVNYFITFEWKINDKSRIEEFEKRMDLFEWEAVKHEIYLITFYKSDNKIKYVVESKTLDYSLKHVIKYFSHLFDQISKEDFEIVSRMRPNYIEGRYESINQKVYDDQSYFKKSHIVCLIDSINNNQNTHKDVLQEKHIGLCYLAILNHLKFVQKWYEQRQDLLFGKNVLKFVYSCENQFNIEYMIICTNELEENAVKRIKFLNLFKKENYIMILLRKKDRNMQYKIEFPISFQNELELASFFKSISCNEFKEGISFYSILELQIGDRVAFIDTGQLNNALEFHYNYLTNEEVWKGYLMNRNPLPSELSYNNRIQLLEPECKNDMEQGIFDFVKKMHEKEMYKTCHDIYNTVKKKKEKVEHKKSKD